MPISFEEFEKKGSKKEPNKDKPKNWVEIIILLLFGGMLLSSSIPVLRSGHFDIMTAVLALIGGILFWLGFKNLLK